MLDLCDTLWTIVRPGYYVDGTIDTEQVQDPLKEDTMTSIEWDEIIKKIISNKLYCELIAKYQVVVRDIKKANHSYLFIFNNSMITCPFCDRIHENENWYYLIYDANTNWLNEHCRRYEADTSPEDRVKRVYKALLKNQ